MTTPEPECENDCFLILPRVLTGVKMVVMAQVRSYSGVEAPDRLAQRRRARHGNFILELGGLIAAVFFRHRLFGEIFGELHVGLIERMNAKRGAGCGVFDRSTGFSSRRTTFSSFPASPKRS